MSSHFFAYISKIRWLQRWGLKRNTVTENVMEHSWEVATITHVLALVRNRKFNGNVDVNAAVVAALYHDVGEVITGDMPSPVKYHSSNITNAYKAIEHQAEQELFQLIPKELQDDFQSVLIEKNVDPEHHELIKAADTIAAYLKCQMEVGAGNKEFIAAEVDIKNKLKAMKLPEVDYFLDVFAESYTLTLDELLK
ncbi:MAG: 5'-deoxynucleotidase [Gammaproteobacteria bacterium]|nr:5'-deoxynucleotidase [Gammaproteobacteria bacterium]